MKYFKELIGSNEYTQWNTRIGGDDYHTLEAHTNILTFMHKLCALNTAKRITWETPGSIKHLCESWLRNGDDPNYMYVTRDLCTSFAIAMGTPVDLHGGDARDNRIGLRITPTQYRNLWYNVTNHGAKDLEWAMKCSPDTYRHKTYKKQRLQTHGY